MRLILLCLVDLVALSSCAHVKPWDNPWAKIQEPASGARGSIGSYSKGCIEGAEAIPLQGTGYQVMRPSRHRYFGHPDLLRFIRELATAVSRDGLGTLLIGDLGQPRGGPMPHAHASHQIGLDVDIWFALRPEASARLLTTGERESWTATPVVDLDRFELLRDRWKPAHVRILKLASERPEVERIFVNPSIKRELCATIPAAEHGWLAKLRPWYEHHDHFHVRLRCPEGSATCLHQEPPPPGDGCGADLDWWFTPEGRKPQEEKPDDGKGPNLPPACQSLLPAPT